MDYEKDVLFEFETKDIGRSRYFIPFIILSMSWISFALLHFIFVFDHLFEINKNIDWGFAFIVLILPVTGLILFINRNKYGWAISLFYYQLIPLLLLSGFLHSLLKKEDVDYTLRDNWQVLLLFLLLLISVLILLSKDIRNYFKITRSKFRMTLVVLSIVAVVTDFVITML